MTDVACFCGRLFSFNGDAEACPRCGRVASVTAGPALEGPGHNRAQHPEPVMNGAATDAADIVLGRSEPAGSVITSLGLLSR
jgi:hypothetical protein